MAKALKFDKFKVCVTINSLVYFLIAYYFVVFSFNLFSMVLVNRLGFDVELFYYGFVWSGRKWTTDYVIFVFFIGNSLTLLYAVIFERLYRAQRKYVRGVKLLFLWIYLISIMWFLGNIIVGSIFNFGIGAALRAYRVPFILRAFLAVVSISVLVYLGYRAQKHVRVSANLYYAKLSKRASNGFIFQQIVIPTIIGILIIILLKIPYLYLYGYADIVLLLTMLFFIAGLFINKKKQSSITFKTRGIGSIQHNTKRCNIAYFPMIIMIVVLLLVRVGLMEGLSF